ncbi:MAG: hypothetical protein H6607_11265 [Flavobacteriales bacterium]|nr:hypothetical protein [Flavobacteriales bacterium]
MNYIRLRFSLLLLFTSCYTFMFAQNIDSLTHRVHDFQQLRVENYFTEKRDSVFKLFDSAWTNLLLIQEFHSSPIDTAKYYHFVWHEYNPVDSLRTFNRYKSTSPITLNMSAEERVKLYSWDGFNGGCNHVSFNYAVYKNSKGRYINFLKNMEFDDVMFGYHQIEMIKSNRKTYYFLFGSGLTCGMGSHRIVRIFTPQNDSLVEVFDAYPNHSKLVNFGNRGMDLWFYFDEKKKSITYKQYAFNEETGFYKPAEYIVIELVFKHGRLVQKQKRNSRMNQK